MSFVLITLRWYHGGKIEFGPPPEYIGGSVTEFLDVDVDRMSYFELRDYIKDLGYTPDCDFYIKWDGLLVLINCDKVIFDLFNMIKNEDEVEVYVCHGINEPEQAPLELEYVTNAKDIGVGEESLNEADICNPNNQPPPSSVPSPSSLPSSPIASPIVPSSPVPAVSSSAPAASPVVPSSLVPSASPVVPSSSVPAASPVVPLSTVHAPSSVAPSCPNFTDPTDDELEDFSGSEEDNFECSEVDSDVHQEYVDIRASKRQFKRSQRRTRGTTSEQIHVNEKGTDIGYDETHIGIRESLVGKLGGAEPYYLSDEVPSFELDDETGWGDGEEVNQDINHVVQKPVRRKKK